ncbi:hypothetical protein GCM10017557_00050 [Streptomyces aurantiacus]|uniref:Uncharacterized protein n=1 Tax=Streptomyces aurantiacus TaxID=47760 RepID=A0A7G1NU87_9ACTN|nr:hypothetical protein GCM10017557_00050 [Streptomyces aurantiacus]
MEKSANSTSVKAIRGVSTSASVPEVGMAQGTGEDHHLLLLAPAGIPGGEQLAGHFSDRYWVISRTRGSSDEPAGAANPNRALVWKTNPSDSVRARRRARTRGCHRALTASSISPACTALGRRRIPGRVVTHLCTVRWEIPRRTATFFVEPFLRPEQETHSGILRRHRTGQQRPLEPFDDLTMPAPERFSTAMTGARRPSALPDLSHQAALPGQFRHSQDTSCGSAKESAVTQAREHPFPKQP